MDGQRQQHPVATGDRGQPVRAVSVVGRRRPVPDERRDARPSRVLVRGGTSVTTLAERLKAYAREDEIKSSASKVVELKKPDQR